MARAASFGEPVFERSMPALDTSVLPLPGYGSDYGGDALADGGVYLDLVRSS